MENSEIKCFVSYSHNDSKICERFRKHLNALSRLYEFTEWYDGKIPIGGEIDKEIKKHLNDANVVFLLISPDYISSYYCYEKELKMAINRHQEGKCIVVPVICKRFVAGNYFFSSLKFVPTDGRPINSFRPQDDGFIEVMNGIKNLLQDFVDNQKRFKKSPPTISSTKAINGNEHLKTIDIKFQIIKSSRKNYEVLKQDVFDKIIAYSQSINIFVLKCDEMSNKQLQHLSTLITPSLPTQNINKYCKNEFDVFLMQIFSYIQQCFIGTTNTCVNCRVKHNNNYVSFVNIGYSSSKLSTDPINAYGGMIECSKREDMPLIKSYNKQLHDFSHPKETRNNRDYITFTFNEISKLYNIDLSMCISVTKETVSKRKEILIPLSVLQIDKVVEKIIIKYVDSCLQIYNKYCLSDILI